MYTHEIFLDEDAQEPLHLEFCEDERNDEVRNDMHVESEYGEDSEPEEEYDEANGQHQVEPYEDMDEEPEFPWLSPERLVLYHVFGYPYQDSSDLDDYQLQVLLKLENEEANYDSFRPKWEALLHTMRDIQQEILTVLFDLFILADRVGVKALRVRVMDHLQAERSWRWDGWGNSIPFELVTKAFNNLPEQSTLCRWLIYVFAWDWKVDSDDANQAAARKTLPSPFLLGVLVLRESRMEGGALDQCYFHEHDTWDELKACRLRRGKELSVDAMEDSFERLLIAAERWNKALSK